RHRAKPFVGRQVGHQRLDSRSLVAPPGPGNNQITLREILTAKNYLRDRINIEPVEDLSNKSEEPRHQQPVIQKQVELLRRVFRRIVTMQNVGERLQREK